LNPKLKLKRPQGINAAGSRGHASFNITPSTLGDGTVDAGHIARAASTPAEADPLAEYPLGRDRVFFPLKAQGEEDLEDALATPLEHEPDLRNVLRGQLVQQAGGADNVSPTMAALLSTILEQRILETKICRALARYGTLRVNRRHGKVSGQAIIKEILLPLQSALRLNLRQFSDEAERARGGGRPQGGADDPYLLLTGEKDVPEALTEIMLVTATAPVDATGVMRPPTPDEIVAEFKATCPEAFAAAVAQGAKRAQTD
jgi:hypothetical protein